MMVAFDVGSPLNTPSSPKNDPSFRHDSTCYKQHSSPEDNNEH